jgi:glyoxylase-like metal-dependent hydrolase (beta-lactamase superfamily II)
MRNTIVAIAVSLAATAAFAQQDFSKVEITVTKVAGSIYMLQGAGGNIGVSAGDDGIVIVDDQYAPLAPKVRAALKGIADKPIKFILNTHYHGDHTGGNADFGRDGTIIAQTNVRKRLSSGTVTGGNNIPPAPAGALPIITFDDKLSLHANGEEIRAEHFPHGHTDGDAVIWFTKSNVVHMGDDFFNGMFPFVDLDNGGSIRGMAANVAKVLATLPDDAKVIPGHGPLGDKAALKRFGDMLYGTIGAVQSAITAGKTLEDMQKENILAAWSSWGTGFIKTDRWLTTIHAELSRK